MAELREFSCKMPLQFLPTSHPIRLEDAGVVSHIRFIKSTYKMTIFPFAIAMISKYLPLLKNSTFPPPAVVECHKNHVLVTF